MLFITYHNTQIYAPLPPPPPPPENQYSDMKLTKLIYDTDWENIPSTKLLDCVLRVHLLYQMKISIQF